MISLGILGLAGNSIAANLPGKWTGKMKLDGTAYRNELVKRGKKLKGEEKKQLDQKIKLIDESIVSVGKTVIKLDIKKDGIAFIEFNRSGTKTPGEWCKWNLKGQNITLSGFSGMGDETMVFSGKMIEGGKKIQFDASQIILKQLQAKGLKNNHPPKLTITFTKV